MSYYHPFPAPVVQAEQVFSTSGTFDLLNLNGKDLATKFIELESRLAKLEEENKNLRTQLENDAISNTRQKVKLFSLVG